MKYKIKFNKITWYSKLAAAVFFLAVLFVLTFYMGQEYQKTPLNIEGIDPYNISNAPVPSSESEEESADTTFVLRDEDGHFVHFDNGSIDLDTFSGYRDLSANYMILQLLGYARMGRIPTAITLVSEKIDGTGYFPSLVLYQAKDDKPQIFQVIPLQGDRIAIHSLLIKDNLISLSFLSWGDQATTTKEYRFTNLAAGKLMEVKRVQ
ncbi:MAG: hypothetical protein V4481_05360 [Patescibacteria group bacterium]